MAMSSRMNSAKNRRSHRKAGRSSSCQRDGEAPSDPPRGSRRFLNTNPILLRSVVIWGWCCALQETVMVATMPPS